MLARVEIENAPRGQVARGLHSARTKSFSFMKSGKVSFVREETSEAEATAAPTKPSARVVKVRMLAALRSVSYGAWVLEELSKIPLE
jgi:hypothetical protein